MLTRADVCWRILTDKCGHMVQVWRLGIQALYRACWHTRNLPLEQAHTSARSGSGGDPHPHPHPHPHPQPHPHPHPHLRPTSLCVATAAAASVGGASVGEGLATWALEHYLLKAEANEDAVETLSSLHALAAIIHLLVYLLQSLNSA